MVETEERTHGCCCVFIAVAWGAGESKSSCAVVAVCGADVHRHAQLQGAEGAEGRQHNQSRRAGHLMQRKQSKKYGCTRHIRNQTCRERSWSSRRHVVQRCPMRDGIQGPHGCPLEARCFAERAKCSLVLMQSSPEMAPARDAVSRRYVIGATPIAITWYWGSAVV